MKPRDAWDCEVSFSGVEYYFTLDAIDGMCTRQETPVIYVDARLKSARRLETLIHECVHAMDPLMTEEQVTKNARSLAAILWRDGWRRKT